MLRCGFRVSLPLSIIFAPSYCNHLLLIISAELWGTAAFVREFSVELQGTLVLLLLLTRSSMAPSSLADEFSAELSGARVSVENSSAEVNGATVLFRILALRCCNHFFAHGFSAEL